MRNYINLTILFILVLFMTIQPVNAWTLPSFTVDTITSTDLNTTNISIESLLNIPLNNTTSPVNGTLYWDGTSLRIYGTGWNYGLTNSSFIAGENITVTDNGNGTITLSSVAGTTETTWSFNRNANGYNLTNASTISSSDIDTDNLTVVNLTSTNLSVDTTITDSLAVDNISVYSGLTLPLSINSTPGNGSLYWDGSNIRVFGTKWVYGLGNSSVLAGTNITVTDNGNGTISISSNGLTATETTWTADRNANGYNLTNATNISGVNVNATGIVAANVNISSSLNLPLTSPSTPNNGSLYWNGSNFRVYGTQWVYGLTNASILSGANTTVTDNGNGTITIASLVAGVTETTWTTDKNANSYNLTNITNLTGKNIGGVVYSSQYTTGSTTGGIQEAMDALTAGRTWKETVKVTGNHTVTNIQVPSYTILDLSDAKLTLNSTVNGDINGNGGCAIEISGATNVEVFGGHIDGNGANLVNGYQGYNPSCGILVRNASYVNVHHITIINGKWDGIITSNDTHDVSFTDNDISNSGFEAMGAEYDAYNITMSRNTIHDNQLMGIESSWSDEITFRPSPSKKIITDNIIYNNVYGMTVEGQNDSFPTETIISGNNIFNNSYDGLIVLSANNLLISDNIFKGNGHHGLLVWSNTALHPSSTNITNISIHDNIATDNTQTGITLLDGLTNPGSNYGITNFQVSGNMIARNGWHGLWLQYLKRGLVSDNIIYDNGISANNTYGGILLEDAQGVFVTGNNVYESGWTANRQAYGIGVADVINSTVAMNMLTCSVSNIAESGTNSNTNIDHNYNFTAGCP